MLVSFVFWIVQLNPAPVLKLCICLLFSCASAKAERSLSSLSCMCVYVDQNKGTPPPPRNGISTGNSLISSPDLDSPQKFILDWYLFLNGYLQITLIQIYFWYYKTIWGHFNNGYLFLLQTTQPIRMQGQQKSCHLLEKNGTHPMRMHDNNTTCNRSNQNAGFLDTTNTTCNRSNQNARLPDTHSRSTNQHPAAPDTTKTMCYWSTAQCWKAFLVFANMPEMCQTK